MEANIWTYTTQKVIGVEYEGNIVIEIEEWRVRQEFIFRVINPYDPTVHLTVQKHGRIFLEMNGELTLETLKNYSPEQQVILTIAREMLIKDIEAIQKYHPPREALVLSREAQRLGGNLNISQKGVHTLKIPEGSPEVNALRTACV